MIRFNLTLITLFCFYFSHSQNSDEKKKSDYKTVDNIVVNSKDYALQIRYTQFDFNLKILNGKENSESQPYSRNITKENLFRGVINLVQTIDTTLQDSLIGDKEKAYILGLKDRIDAHIRKDEESKKTELERITTAVDNAKDKFSGELTLHKEITNFKIIKPDKKDIERYYSHLYKTSQSSKDTQTTTRIDGKEHSPQKDTLFIKDATLIFFNNKASTIAVNAVIKYAHGEEETLEFYNYDFSMPMRSFTYYDNPGKWIHRAKYTLEADTKYGETVEVHVNDLFDYRSFGNGKIGNFGFSIANQRVHISNKLENANPVKIVQRRFFDFFTGVVHSDLLGLNTNSSNSLINAQASLLMPMNLGNWEEVTLLRQFRLNLNVALNNSFENEDRYIGFSNGDRVNHFDLYRKNNLNGILSLDVFSYESKGWFLTWSAGYNVGFYRTGYQYTNTINGQEDEVTTGQLLSIVHGPYLNFEFRPQDNFGADIMISLDELNLNDDDIINQTNINDGILVNDESESLVFNHNIVNVSANFYWLTNPEKSNGGVYARLGLAYHTPTRASFPQLMVGYATNLTSFVNRFKQKDENGN